MSARGPTSSKSRGTRSTITSCREASGRAPSSDRRAHREKATITRSTSLVATSSIEIVEATEHRKVRDLRPPVARMLVDEADELDPVLGMLLDLARRQLADMTRTDHDRRAAT